MPMNPVGGTAALTAGLRANFAKTYESSAKASEEKLKLVMELGVPTTTRTTPFAYSESAVYPRHWPYGEDIDSKSFNTIGYTVTARRWAESIPYYRDDVKDDQIGIIKKKVYQLADNFGTLNERVLMQLRTSAADGALLPAIPTAPDGAAFYAATAGGADRFGVTDGNLVSGATVASVANIHTDYYKVISRFLRMLDTEGQPLHSPELIDKGVVVTFGALNIEMFEAAFHQHIIQGSSAGISNVILNAMRKVTLWATSRITDNDWFVDLAGSELKAVAQLELESLYTSEAHNENSDHARKTGEESFQAVARYGYSLNLPYMSCQVNN